MKVLTTNPHGFLAGDVLDPNDIGRTLRYAADAFADVSTLRAQEAPLLLPFIRGFSFTQAASLEERTARIRAPFNCTIERAFLSANLVSDGEVQITIEASGGALPEGATSPWLTTTSASLSAAVDVNDIATERVTLVAGTTYLVKVVLGPGATVFVIDRLDVLLHLRFDRWQLAAATTLVPPTYTVPRSGDARDAVALNASLTSLAAAAALLSTNNGVVVPIVAIQVNFVTGATAGQTDMPIPRLSSTRAQGRVVRIDMFVHWDAATADTVTGTLRDETGAALETITCAGGGGTFTPNTLSCNRSIVSATANVTTTVAQDYAFRMVSSGAANVRKAYAILWVAR